MEEVHDIREYGWRSAANPGSAYVRIWADGWLPRRCFPLIGTAWGLFPDGGIEVGLSLRPMPVRSACSSLTAAVTTERISRSRGDTLLMTGNAAPVSSGCSPAGGSPGGHSPAGSTNPTPVLNTCQVGEPSSGPSEAVNRRRGRVPADPLWVSVQPNRANSRRSSSGVVASPITWSAAP
jgi:hypothetical protein